MYLKLYYLEHYSIFWNFLKVEENYKTNFFFLYLHFFFKYINFCPKIWGLPLVGGSRQWPNRLSGLGLGPTLVRIDSSSSRRRSKIGGGFSCQTPLGGFTCQTPPGGLTSAWKVSEAIKVATTKRAFLVSLSWLGWS